MTLELLLHQLVPGAPERERAAHDLLEWLEREVRLPQRDDRKEVASEVVFSLLRRAVSGKPAPDDPDSYVRAMVRNAAIGLCRRKARMRPLEEAGEPQAPTDDTQAVDQFERDVAADRVRARATLREPFAALLERGLPRYRAEWRRAFAQLEELVFEGADLRALVIRDGALDGGDERVVQAALDRAYTAHRRLRDRLDEQLDALVAEGRVSARRAREMRACLALLFRAGVRAR
jgi:hypothetical protein